MKFYEFGNKENPSIMLLPGTCCHWKNNFGPVIDGLMENFYVICASYDGFDETEQTEFPDMITEVEKIENYIKKELNGTIHAVYGCSLGGSFVGLLAQRREIHMNHGILGSSDLDQASKRSASFGATVMLPIFYRIMQTGKIPNWLIKRLRKHTGEQYTQKAMEMFGFGGTPMTFVTKKSMRNQYYWDLVTNLDDHIEVEGSKIHCFYAEKMGEIYVERYEQHFKDPDIVHHNMQHEELLVCYPKQWVEEVKRVVTETV